MRYAVRKVYQNKPSAELSNEIILGIVVPKSKPISLVFEVAIYQSEVVDG